MFRAYFNNVTNLLQFLCLFGLIEDDLLNFSLFDNVNFFTPQNFCLILQEDEYNP
jgi:hypothetical protein